MGQSNSPQNNAKVAKALDAYEEKSTASTTLMTRVHNKNWERHKEKQVVTESVIFLLIKCTKLHLGFVSWEAGAGFFVRLSFVPEATFLSVSNVSCIFASAVWQCSVGWTLTVGRRQQAEQQKFHATLAHSMERYMSTVYHYYISTHRMTEMMPGFLLWSQL